MNYIFDLDGTLLDTKNGDYASAQPIENRIKILVDLYNAKNTITIQTARGRQWQRFTEEQLKYFQIPYHVLDCGNKIWGDVYVDDKGINAKEFFK